MKNLTILVALSCLFSCVDVHTVSICTPENAININLEDGIYEGRILDIESEEPDIANYKIVNTEKGKISLFELAAEEEAHQVLTCKVNGKLYAEFYDEIQNTFMISEIKKSSNKTNFLFQVFDRDYLKNKGFFYQSTLAYGMNPLDIRAIEPIILYNETIPTSEFLKALKNASFWMTLEEK